VRRLALAVVAALAALGGPAAAQTAGPAPAVSIGFAAYTPAHIDVLAGDTVTWSNDSVRTHTVTATDGAWSSARLTGGDTFARRFDATGAFPYYCQIHGFMRGEVDVHRLLLDAPAEPGAPRRAFGLSGRAALPAGAAVTIEGDSGTGFAPVARATVAPDGAFTAEVVPSTTTTYRAVAGAEASPPVRLLVLDRRVAASATPRGRGRVVVSARVTPASPGATVVLQLRLRERFGWWPVRRARLGRASTARLRLRLRRRVPARVVLTLADGATVLAKSPTLHVGPRRQARPERRSRSSLAPIS
jgi:plastocyanin